jgi:phosphatidate cytidylyltransferase
MISRMPDLGPRVTTTLILLPLVMLVLFFFPAWAFMMVTAVITLVAAWEWSRLSGITKLVPRAVYVIFILWFLYVISVLPVIWILIAAAVVWLFAIVMIVNYASVKKSYSIVINGLVGAVMLPACWQAVNILCFVFPHPYYLLALLLLIWSADITAYFIGCRWGKHKLAPEISPGKSIEGAGAALLVTVMVSVAIAIIGKFSWQFVLLAVITVMSSIIGDLFESMLKRQWGLKNSGNCLPGHGGILDRIDSLIAAAPIFALGMWLMGLI